MLLNLFINLISHRNIKHKNCAIFLNTFHENFNLSPFWEIPVDIKWVKKERKRNHAQK